MHACLNFVQQPAAVPILGLVPITVQPVLCSHNTVFRSGETAVFAPLLDSLLCTALVIGKATMRSSLRLPSTSHKPNAPLASSRAPLSSCRGIPPASAAPLGVPVGPSTSRLTWPCITEASVTMSQLTIMVSLPQLGDPKAA